MFDIKSQPVHGSRTQSGSAAAPPSPPTRPPRAQVNGQRGETEALDKMRARVQYDINYMRNLSLLFDLMIIGKTLAVVCRDQNAC